MSVNLDKIDFKLLDTLQKEARITNQDLAERIHLSPSSCLQRVRRLEKEGLIRSYHGNLDLARIARHIMCIATISLKNHSQDDFEQFEKLADAIPEVVECYTVSGEPDFFLRIICPDMNCYLEVNEKLIRSSSCQVNINTYVVMKENKRFQGVELSTLQSDNT